MKTRNRLFTVVLMSMMFVNVAPAQTTKSNPSNVPAVLNVDRHRKQVTTQTASDTTTYNKMRNADVSFKTKQAFVNGEAWAFDNENKDVEGNKLSRPFLGIGGGGNFLLSDKDIRPNFFARLGWEKKRFLTFVDFNVSWSGFNVSSNVTANGVTEGAEASGNYTTLSGTLNGAWKCWQDARYRSFIAFKAGAGYGYCKTDGDADAIRFSSSFYGFIWNAGVMGKLGLSRHWGLTLDLSIGNTARNFHDSEQDMNAIALKGGVGVSYTF